MKEIFKNRHKDKGRKHFWGCRMSPKGKVFFVVVFIFMICGFLSSDVNAGTISKPGNNLGLIGYWSFNDATSTKAIDFSGNGNTGTLTNMANPATATSGWGTGKLGAGLNFDGTDDYVQTVASTQTEALGSWSISAWVKSPTLGTSNTMAIVGRGKSGSDARDYLLYASNGKFSIQRSNGSSFPTLVTTSTYSSNVWYHVVGVFNGTTGTIYVNGIADGSASLSLSISSDSARSVTIGNLHQSSDLIFPFNGSIDEVRIYSRALTAAQVTSLYSAGLDKIMKGPSNKGLVGYWSFNEATSTSAYDYSGNGNTGTLTNMAFPPTATSGWGTGKFGSGLNFDGTNDYVRGSNTGFPSGTADRTISAWFKTTTNRSNTQYGTILFYGSEALNQAVYLLVGTDSTLGTNACGPSQYGDSVGSGVAVNDGLWHNCTVTFSGGTWSVYLDGVFRSSKAMTTNTTLGTQVTIGSTNSGALPFNGSIDEVRVYNRVLSASEISTLYNAKAKKFNASQNVTGTTLDSGLAGHWSFDGQDMSGTTAYDRSGNGNNGTLTSSPIRTIGKLSQALQFNETNTYVNVPDATSLNVTSQFTLSAWIYWNGNVGNIDTIFMKNNSNSAYYGMYVFSNRVWFYNPTITLASALNTVPTNTWVHAVITFDSTLPSNNAKMYINGAFDNAVTKTSAYASSVGGTLSIGRDPVNGRYFGGKVDDVRIYNRALSAQEVQLLYNLGK